MIAIALAVAVLAAVVALERRTAAGLTRARELAAAAARARYRRAWVSPRRKVGYTLHPFDAAMVAWLRMWLVRGRPADD